MRQTLRLEIRRSGQRRRSLHVKNVDSHHRPHGFVANQEINSVFPTEVPRSAADVSYEMFRMEYIWKLSDDIGRLFYPWYIGDQMTNTA